MHSLQHRELDQHGINGLAPFSFLRPIQSRDTTGPVWSWDDDPRITRIGKILRVTHLDELPQLWNVLRGEMSFVGPRPERPVFVERLEQVIPGYTHRLAIRPGITGLSQLCSGYDESVRTVTRKVRYDLLYVRRACALLDAMILLDTMLLMIGMRGGLALRRSAVRETPSHHPVTRLRHAQLLRL